MKSHFKNIFIIIIILLMNTTVSHSRDVILVENLADNQAGQTLLRILQQKFNIPRRLITYRNVNRECIKNSDAIMQLCLKADGELDIVKINRIVIAETFRIFSEAGE
jgi:hypothetical protein